ncbi:LysR substrate-binding domain-containing protein [Mesorhizobium delmotii]|uniref:LysR substrate-binding domain-containing protein n=1 Tax=Mesorhizobium delmotii TaxID=1631247 RepID=A0A2P9AXZ4_9HYPH|nr:LysR substrate-binding domain-containing protein [Mesorhizobium delmotii]SJM36039.1 hypothetical protein BQ8482_960006 [Mesorhizobium delmotii]
MEPPQPPPARPEWSTALRRRSRRQSTASDAPTRGQRGPGFRPRPAPLWHWRAPPFPRLDAGQAQLAAHRGVPSGRLRVDLPLAFGRRCAAPILFDIAARFPDLTLDISFNDRRVDLVQEGIDIAIRMGELGNSAGLTIRRLCVQRSTICAAPAYLGRNG